MDQGLVSKKRAKQDYEEAFQAVQAILFRTWNPLGLKSRSDALESYAPYASQLIFLAKTGASVADLAGHLAHLEAKQLGLSANSVKDSVRREKSGQAVVRYFRQREEKRLGRGALVHVRRATIKEKTGPFGRPLGRGFDETERAVYFRKNLARASTPGKSGKKGEK